VKYDNPIDVDVRQKFLKYRSVNKLEGMLGHLNTVGFDATAAGFAIGKASRPKTDRELLTEAGRSLQDAGALSYERYPVPGGYFLLRARAACGTMWPWAGDHDFRNVAWWIGRGEHYRVMAYGSRSNLLDGTKEVAEADKGTWWPSDAGSYIDLLRAVSHDVDLDQRDGRAPSSDITLVGRSERFAGLESYCFNFGVERGSPYVATGVYEILMRVDGIDSSSAGLPVVYGSPLWVAQVMDPVAGVYALGDSEVPGLTPVANWDGDSWAYPRWLDSRGPGGHPSGQLPQPPETPTDAPSVSSILTLGLPDRPPGDIVSAAESEAPFAKRRWLGKLFSRWA